MPWRRRAHVVDRRRRPDVDVAAEWRIGARLIGAAVSVHGDDPRPLSHREWLHVHRRRGRAAAPRGPTCSTHVDVRALPGHARARVPHLQDGSWTDRVLQVNGVERRYLELEAWPAIVGAAYLPSTVAPVGRTRRRPAGRGAGGGAVLARPSVHSGVQPAHGGLCGNGWRLLACRRSLPR